MANGFTKLHSGILTSTIWCEDPATKVVWITLLAMADQNGEVEATIPGLAKDAHVSVEETERAIAKFLSPDKYSRTPDEDGRRIEAIDEGWRLLNYQKYRDKMSKEDRNRRNAARQQRFRDKKARNAECNASVTNNGLSRQAEADTEAEAVNPKTIAHSANELGTGASPDLAFNGESKPSEPPTSEKQMSIAKRSALALAIYGHYPRKVGKSAALKAIERAIGVVSKRGSAGAVGNEEAAAQWLETRIVLYAGSAQAQQPDKAKIPHPATWFNEGRFDDDESDWNYVWAPAANHPRQQSSPTNGETDYTTGSEDVLSRPAPAWANGSGK
jgi:hypothetical protein